MTLEKLTKALDAHKPDWWIMFADQTDLRDYARMCSDQHSGTIKAKEMVRNRVIQQMLIPIRAAIDCGMVQLTLRSD